MLQGEFIYEGWVTDSDLKAFTVYNKESALSEVVSAQRTWIIKINPFIGCMYNMCTYRAPVFNEKQIWWNLLKLLSNI